MPTASDAIGGAVIAVGLGLVTLAEAREKAAAEAAAKAGKKD